MTFVLEASEKKKQNDGFHFGKSFFQALWIGVRCAVLLVQLNAEQVSIGQISQQVHSKGTQGFEKSDEVPQPFFNGSNQTQLTFNGFHRSKLENQTTLSDLMNNLHVYKNVAGY